MKTKIKLISALVALAAACLAAGGCTYDKLPPKTGSSNRTYLLPKGELPTAEESAEVAAAREAYRQYIETHP